MLVEKVKKRPQWNQTYSICTHNLDCSQPFYRMFLSYQGDSAVLCEAFTLFTTTVIGIVPQEICCGMW